jgi:hypothetical protein
MTIRGIPFVACLFHIAYQYCKIASKTKLATSVHVEFRHKSPVVDTANMFVYLP